MRFVIAVMIAVMAVISIGQGPAGAQDMTDYCSIPPFVARQGPPLVTLVMGRDHKLYYEAYNDASDLNGDGVLDVGYDHDIVYYGYFDSYQCYTHDGTQFNPSGFTTTRYCSGGEWSGNFLNWLSMSRMDALRKVLYGGSRSTDSATETVLAGCYIPQDAHSWGKEYDGSDTAQLTPYSTPTSGRHLFCVTSLAEDTPPTIRVSLNNSNRVWEWASKERPVCDDSQTINDEFVVRVKVCEYTTDPPPEYCDEHRLCKQYPDGNYKPIGILQRYGTGDGVTKVCSKTFKPCTTSADCDTDDGDCIDLAKMYFGLITGSYEKNLSGGVLRKRMRDMSDEIDSNDGTFIGAYNNDDGAIIPTLEELKTVGFNYSDHTYEGTYDCGWIQDRPITEGECRMWGNPIAEMMYEALRYLASRTTAEFGQSSPDTGLYLAAPSWNAANAPFEKYPWCSKPSMLVISDVKTSYDSDQLPGSSFGSASDDVGGLDVTTRANEIGDNEGIGSTKVFVGQSGTTSTDNVCSAKDVTGLGEIRGQCPEEPIKQGSYYAAAVAHYGKTEFENLLLVDAEEEEDKIYYPPVTTYSVALSSPIPDINIQVGDTIVTLIPAGKLVSGCDDAWEAAWMVWPYCGQKNRSEPYAAYSGRCDLDYYDNTETDPALNDRGLVISNCEANAYCMSSQIVDFYVDGELTSTHGKFRINFEDAEQGADHDMDSIVTYEYTVSGNDVTITLDSSVYSAGCVDQALGFFISGTGSSNTDGLYLPVKTNHTPDTETNWTPAAVAALPRTWSKTFTISSGGETATLLKDPLWFAAKYGGFNDINDNDMPDDTREWDRDEDDVPDNYFLVHNPLKLEDQLNKAIGEILKRVSSGTAVSVLSTSAGGEGSLFQAYFNPSVFDTGGREVTWVGYLNALWVDQYGNLREDTGSGGDPDQHLVLTEDPIVVYDLEDGDTVVRKYADGDGDGEIDDPDHPLGSYSLLDLQALWEGGEQLSKRTTSRKIYTYVDEDGDTVVDEGEFDDNKFDAADAGTLYPYLNAEGADVAERTAHAEKIIRYIRGEDVEATDSNYRDRRLTVDGVEDTVWRLGDIVYSTPTVVGRPMENYHLIYGDTTYLDYVREHKDRKTVIYVGANDGMLHAFSAGTYHEGDDTTTGNIEEGWYSGDFGTELWAYIPYNLLPQLKWLCDLTYCHVYYVDLKAKVVDARIFTADSDHPNGWGTVLVGAMRLGGKDVTRTDTYDGTNSEERSFRSAYFALDVTVPDSPVLLWEFSDGNLNFTTSYPAVFRVGTAKPFDSNTGYWYVIFGSGPTTFEGAGAATGRVYILDLATGGPPVRTYDIDGTSNPIFMASPITIDLGLDYQVDIAYIGASYYDSTDARWEGKLFRIEIDEDTTVSNWDFTTFVTFDQPITIAPAAALDPYDRLWLYWGTGRFFAGADKTDTTTQRLYGVWDPETVTVDASGDPPATLNDVTEIKVYEGGYMDVGGTPTTFNAYLTDRRGEYSTPSKYGWYLKMTSPIALDGERAINTATVLGDIVLFPTFKPEADICAYGGTSYLYALYYETGTAFWKSIIGVDETDWIDDDGYKYKVFKKLELGAGMPTSVVIHAGQEEGVKGMVQLGTGVVKVLEIDPASSPQSKVLYWREKAD